MEATFCTSVVTTVWHLSGYYYKHISSKSRPMEATFCTPMATTAWYISG